MNAKNEIVDRKARNSVRGDLMEPHMHYDPTKLATYTAHHDSVRIIFALAAAYNLDLRHFDFDAASFMKN